MAKLLLCTEPLQQISNLILNLSLKQGSMASLRKNIEAAKSNWREGKTLDFAPTAQVYISFYRQQNNSDLLARVHFILTHRQN